MYMTQGLRRAAKLTPERIALISDGRSLSWSELLDRVARLAGALKKLGLRPDDRVAMLSLKLFALRGVLLRDLLGRWQRGPDEHPLVDGGTRLFNQ